MAHPEEDLEANGQRGSKGRQRAPLGFISKGQIDEYAKYLQDFVLGLAEKTVPTAKSHQEAGAPRCRWWSSEVDKTVKVKPVCVCAPLVQTNKNV